MDEVFDIKEVATYLHCSESTIRKLVRNNGIPFYRIARRIFFRKTFIDNWVMSQCRENIEQKV